WIVIQQRINNLQSFNQSWNVYKFGFGTYNQNFWLGLEQLHQLTKAADYRLRFEVLLSGIWVSDQYNHFRINSELEKYSINVSGYSGITWIFRHNGVMFSTPDQDNSPQKTNCAGKNSNGNWFVNCYCQNVNGRYGSTFYYALYNAHVAITSCRMMIKLNI
ncbi:hypothetical protein HELRODRAFT_84990, partial [Helobdella robusta]|uniref:Fibrinogen C-terminal domain-containing protein n=1 Tax=Helobdella robusta TaxID=6412 RepID=T1G5R2_HELRO